MQLPWVKENEVISFYPPPQKKRYKYLIFFWGGGGEGRLIGPKWIGSTVTTSLHKSIKFEFKFYKFFLLIKIGFIKWICMMYFVNLKLFQHNP